MTTCSHSSTIKQVRPSARGREECLKIGSAWVHCVSAVAAAMSAAVTSHPIAMPQRISTRPRIPLSKVTILRKARDGAVFTTKR